MKTNRLQKFPKFLIGILVVLFSCELDPEKLISEPDLALLEDEFEINTVLEDLDNVTLNAMESSGLGLRVMNLTNGNLCSSAVLNHDEGSKKITVDFGTGCTGSNGITRKGKVIFNYTGSFLVPGSDVTTSFVGYEVNGLKVEGSRTLTNTGVNLQNLEISLTVKMQNGKVTWQDGKTSTFSTDQVRRITMASSGYEVSVTGKGEGKTRGGKSYTAEITEALIVTQACLESGISVPNKGKVNLNFSIFSATVDYGAGECDKKLQINYPGGSKEVILD
jgi:hypothetical protein